MNTRGSRTTMKKQKYGWKRRFLQGTLFFIIIGILAVVIVTSLGFANTIAEHEMVERTGLSPAVIATSGHVEEIMHSDDFRGLFGYNKSSAMDTSNGYTSYPAEMSMIQSAKGSQDSLNWPFNHISLAVLIDPEYSPGYGKSSDKDSISTQTEEKAAQILSRETNESKQNGGSAITNTNLDEPEIKDEPDIRCDAVLDTLIEETVMPFTLLSLQIVLAIDQCDENQLMKHAEDLFILSVQSWEKADALNVTYEYLPKKTAYLRSMEEYLVASNSLRLGLPIDTKHKNRDMAHLITGTDRLMQASRDTTSVVMTQDMLRHASTLSHYSTQTQYPDALSLRQRYVYFDSRKANQLSVLPRSAHKINQFWQNSPTGTIWYNAPIGYSYIMVYIRYTHLGNWAGAHYTTSTPALSAHTLSAHGQNYAPRSDLPQFISEGELYTRKTLNRNEGTEGFLVFEVPSLLELENTYLKVALGGDYGTQIWDLGS